MAEHHVDLMGGAFEAPDRGERQAHQGAEGGKHLQGVECVVELVDDLEIFHNRKRRHSALGMHTPIEFEKLHTYPSEVA